MEEVLNERRKSNHQDLWKPENRLAQGHFKYADLNVSSTIRMKCQT